MIPLARPLIGARERAAVLDVLDSGQLAQGPRVATFEHAFATLCGVQHAVAVSSGTAALHTALAALGIGPGDEVVTTPFTFVATANAILMQGATPRFADIEPETFTLDPAAVEQAITARTKAILAVDLFGHPYLRELDELAQRHGIPLIEDACQAVGAHRDGVPAGALGTLAAFSFYATKNMTTGEGGMLTTSDEQLADRARRFRHHGQSARYTYESMGYNYRMTDLQAALGLVQLEQLSAWNEQRRTNARALTAALSGLPGIVLPREREGARHVYHQYTIRVTAGQAIRDAIQRYLAEHGVTTAVFYPRPLHLQPHFVSLGYQEGAFPEAERAAQEVLSLPVHPALTPDDLHTITSVFRQAMEECA